MPKILIVGGGYAGFYTAWKLEKWLRKGEAEVTDRRPAALHDVPAVPPRGGCRFHRAASRRRLAPSSPQEDDDPHGQGHQHQPRRQAGDDHARSSGEPYELDYDIIVVTAGAVSRTFPIPGVADKAIGLKTIEEAVAIRDRVLTNFDKAAKLPAGPERDRLLTFTVVGGGFAGIEIFAELRSLRERPARSTRTISFDDTHFHLIEAMGRIMPEVVARDQPLGASRTSPSAVRRSTSTRSSQSAVDGKIELSTGESFESDLIVWTAGVMANPTIVRNTDLPIEERGRLKVRADLRVGTDDDVGSKAPGAPATSPPSPTSPVAASAASACRTPSTPFARASCSRRTSSPFCVARARRTTSTRTSEPSPASASASACSSRGKLAIKGFPAWIAHRGYHGLAMPSWERKIRVVGGWVDNFFLGRDIARLEHVQHPRAAFEEFASRPKPPAAAAPVEAPAPAAAPAKKAPVKRKPAAAKVAPAAPAGEVAEPAAEPTASAEPARAK